MKKIKKRTMIELKAAIYKAENWKHKFGDNRSKRCLSTYNIEIDHKTNYFVATHKNIH